MEYLINAANDLSIDETIYTLYEVYDEIVSEDLKNEIKSVRRRLSSYEEITSTEVNNLIGSYRTTSVDLRCIGSTFSWCTVPNLLGKLTILHLDPSHFQIQLCHTLEEVDCQI